MNNNVLTEFPPVAPKNLGSFITTILAVTGLFVVGILLFLMNEQNKATTLQNKNSPQQSYLEELEERKSRGAAYRFKTNFDYYRMQGYSPSDAKVLAQQAVEKGW